MKLLINKVNENWIVDRLVDEWTRYNYKTKKIIFGKKDIIWIIAPLTWRKIPKYFLKNNKVLCTIHHIDEKKFQDSEKKDFMQRDEIVDHYHVISNKTYSQLSKITSKPITVIPWWVNQNIWFDIKETKHLFEKYNLPNKKFLIGSFQRDTEGYDLKSPKLSKGPDKLIQSIKQIQEEEEVFVVLAGKRRQFVIKELERNGINYKYFEMLSFTELNELYNLLDLYIVSSRFEGGPQAIVECAITNTPIVSTNVGIASEILSSESIFVENILEATPNVKYANKMIENLKIPKGFDQFNSMLSNLYEN